LIHARPNAALQIVNAFLDRLIMIRDWFQRQTVLHFYASSILLVYEGYSKLSSKVSFYSKKSIQNILDWHPDDWLFPCISFEHQRKRRKLLIWAQQNCWIIPENSGWPEEEWDGRQNSNEQKWANSNYWRDYLMLLGYSFYLGFNRKYLSTYCQFLVIPFHSIQIIVFHSIIIPFYLIICQQH